MKYNNIKLLKKYFAFLTTIISILILSSCSSESNDITKEGMNASFVTKGGEIIVSGEDVGVIFTIATPTAVNKNTIINLSIETENQAICYLATDRLTIPKGYKDVKGRIIFKSNEIKKIGNVQNIKLNINSNDINIGNASSIDFSVKFEEEKPEEKEDIKATISCDKKDITINAKDDSAEITITMDKPSKKEVIFDLTSSNAVKNRYTLNNEQLIIPAGETTAKTNIIFHHQELIYKSSRADVKISIKSNLAKIDKTKNSIQFNVGGTKDVTIPNSEITDRKDEVIIDFIKTSSARIVLWNIEETTEDTAIKFEVIGAKYGTQYKNSQFSAEPIMVIKKEDCLKGRQQIEYNIHFISSAFEAGKTTNLTVKATIISGPARFSDDLNDNISEVPIKIVL